MPINVSLKEELSVKAGPALRQAQRQRFDDAADYGYAHSQELVPEDRGTLRASGFEPTWTQDGAIEWGYRANHAWPMETGTQPFQPPIQPLLEWSKLVSGGTGLGWYVATVKIPTEGVDAQPYAGPAAEMQKRFLQSHPLGDYLDDEL